MNVSSIVSLRPVEAEEGSVLRLHLDFVQPRDLGIVQAPGLAYLDGHLSAPPL